MSVLGSLVGLTNFDGFDRLMHFVLRLLNEPFLPAAA